MVKTSCHDVQKGVGNEEEDEKTITHAPKQHGSGNWTTFSRRSGQRRSGKGSRERLSSNQKADPKLKSFTPQEEELVIQLHAAIGSRWHIIAQQLPGKADNDVKILWNSKLRKRLSAMGIDPVTHKPFSQILADYGNIGAFPKARTRFTSLSRDFKNAIMSKPEHSQKHLHHHPEPSDHHSLQLYSQLQAVNLVAEASNYGKTACSSESQERSSFNWSDFFIEDALLPMENGGGVVKCDEKEDGKMSVGAVEDEINGGNVLGSNSFEGSSSSNSSSFVEAMIGGGQDDGMFSQLPCFYEEPFYF